VLTFMRSWWPTAMRMTTVGPTDWSGTHIGRRARSPEGNGESWTSRLWERGRVLGRLTQRGAEGVAPVPGR
jgi:hypothetical protein